MNNPRMKSQKIVHIQHSNEEENACEKSRDVKCMPGQYYKGE